MRTAITVLEIAIGGALLIALGAYVFEGAEVILDLVF
jgi:hypothetical protein